MKSEYNSLKKRVLKVLAEQEGWISVPGIAAKVNLPYSDRGLYPYLRRLGEFGLVQVGPGKGRRVYYRITPRGRGRLEFLAKNG
jgi:DNA-binding PadR family transcriptional regulator